MKRSRSLYPDPRRLNSSSAADLIVCEYVFLLSPVSATNYCNCITCIATTLLKMSIYEKQMQWKKAASEKVMFLCANCETCFHLNLMDLPG